MARSDSRIWIGVPAATDGPLGGLWYSEDCGGSWQRADEVMSVYSVLLDPADSRRVLVSEIERSVATNMGRLGPTRNRLLRSVLGGGWETFEGPLAPGQSESEFIGVVPGHGLGVRVDGDLYVLARTNLLRARLLGR